MTLDPERTPFTKTSQIFISRDKLSSELEIYCGNKMIDMSEFKQPVFIQSKVFKY